MKCRGAYSPEMGGKSLKHNFLLYFKFCSTFFNIFSSSWGCKVMNKGGFGGFSTKAASYSVHENFYYSYYRAQLSWGFGCFVHRREPGSRTGGWGREEGRDDLKLQLRGRRLWMCWDQLSWVLLVNAVAFAALWSCWLACTWWKVFKLTWLLSAAVKHCLGLLLGLVFPWNSSAAWKCECV